MVYPYEGDRAVRPAVQIQSNILVASVAGPDGIVYEIQGATDAEKVITDQNALTAGAIRGRNPSLSEVKTPLDLGDAGPIFGSEIHWSSDLPEILAGDGTLDRPAAGESAAEVTLTATITHGEAAVTRTFSVSVRPREDTASRVGLSGNPDLSTDADEAAAVYTAALDEALGGVPVTFSLGGFAAGDIAALSTGAAADLVGGGLTVPTGGDGTAQLTIAFAPGTGKTGILSASIDASDALVDTTASDTLALRVDTTAKTARLQDLSIGDRVVDPSWEWEFRAGTNYGTTATDSVRPVVWIVVAKDHYGENSGVTLLSEELIGRYRFDNSSTRGHSFGSGHWGDSGAPNASYGLRIWLNSTGPQEGSGFFHAFSDSFAERVVPVALPNREWEHGIPYTTTDHVFLPSTTELGDSVHLSTYEIGQVYPYFAGSTADDLRTVFTDYSFSLYQKYWTRSPSPAGPQLVNTFHSWHPWDPVPAQRFEQSAASSWSSFYVRPALNLAGDTRVTLTGDPGGPFEILPGAPDPGEATLSGLVDLPGRDDNSGVEIRAMVDGTEWGSTQSLADGSFVFSGLAPGALDLLLSMRTYLQSRVPVSIPHGGETVLAEPIRLRPGDINTDGTVDILDLTLLASAFRAVQGVHGNYHPDADLNADGAVDILDLTLLAGSFRQSHDE